MKTVAPAGAPNSVVAASAEKAARAIRRAGMRILPPRGADGGIPPERIVLAGGRTHSLRALVSLGAIACPGA
ncbi:hypothetical protein GCM10010215_46770 [Streptomyces virginiae]|uniref:Uncharacterized protein n=1 Tax=Streptomyces virginiae TaxID=1961 RepID=A0ABQ3NWA8_STRVG|nr:hypothetical protein GCM10010215_46770 [Streptomyces virginiae]GHI17049.1 hypothetical protein Scinn_65120 [Streptomyces virginiae]